jgi:sec-independent protein translocase protein TatC
METDLTGAGTPAADADEGEAGEAAADDAGADSYGTEVDAADLETSDTSELGPSAPDDEELPLAVHIEEMVKRLLVVIAVMAVVSVIVFPLADRLINFIWFSFLPGSPPACSAVAQSAFAQSNLSTVGGNGTSLLNGSSAVATNATGNLSANTTAAIANGSLNASQTVAAGGPACPRLYHPLSLVLARLKVASLVGFVIALPVFVYQTYAFMRPGLYPNERRYYLASVPTSLVLAAIGIAFAHLLVLPVIFTYFVTYSEQATTLAFGLQQTFDLMLLMFGLFAVVFQIPLFIMLAIMMGVTSREWLTGRRLYFWAGFAGIAFLFAPEPTGMAPFLTAATMILLFEITLLLLRWTGR